MGYAEFERYARMWIPLVEKFGGEHHGYFLPHEGPNNIALALFSFPTLSAYEGYRTSAATDADCQAAVAYYEETRCCLSFERSFMRPLFKEPSDAEIEYRRRITLANSPDEPGTRGTVR